MDDRQIIGMITGIQAALVHLADVLERKDVLPRNEFAAGLRATAHDLPDAQTTDIVRYMLNHLADGVDGPGDPVEARRRMFQLIQGGKPDRL